MVYLPLCCNWRCQWTLKLIETDLSLISEAAGFLKVEDRLVRSLLPHLFPFYFRPLPVAVSLCLRAVVGGDGGQLEEWQPLPGSLLTVPIWCAATESRAPRLPSTSLILSPPTSHRKSCASWWFSDANCGAAKWFFPSCCLLLHLPLGPRRRRPPACHSVQWN